MILVSMKREDPTLYYGTKQLYFGRVNFKITGDGNSPLRKTCYKKKKKKRLRKTRVKDVKGHQTSTESVFLYLILKGTLR